MQHEKKPNYAHLWKITGWEKGFWFHYKNGIDVFPLLVNSALRYFFFQAKSMIAADINCGNKLAKCMSH